MGTCVVCHTVVLEEMPHVVGPSAWVAHLECVLRRSEASNARAKNTTEGRNN
jgi:hypothetical protein